MFGHRLLPHLLALVLPLIAAGGCQPKGHKRRVKQVVDLPVYELTGPVTTFATVAKPGARPERLERLDHQSMYDQGYLWVGYVASRLSPWHVAGKLRTKGVTHWYAQPFSKTIIDSYNYCSKSINMGYSYQQGPASGGTVTIKSGVANICTDTATKVYSRQDADGLVGQLFMPRSQLPAESHAALEKAWGDFLVLEALHGRPVLELARRLGGGPNSEVNGLHWIDYACQSKHLRKLDESAVLHLLSMQPHLPAHHTQCLQSKFYDHWRIMAALMERGQSGAIALEAATQQLDCLSVKVLQALGAPGEACQAIKITGEKATRAREAILHHILRGDDYGLYMTRVLAPHAELIKPVKARSNDRELTIPLLTMVVARNHFGAKSGQPLSDASAWVSALLEHGADPNAAASFDLFVSGESGHTINATEAALLLEQHELANLLQQAGGTAAAEHLTALRALWKSRAEP